MSVRVPGSDYSSLFDRPSLRETGQKIRVKKGCDQFAKQKGVNDGEVHEWFVSVLVVSLLQANGETIRQVIYFTGEGRR